MDFHVLSRKVDNNDRSIIRALDQVVGRLVAPPGEVQSVVIPPGKKMSECPNGRVLVTHDGLRPVRIKTNQPEDMSAEPVVAGRDLDSSENGADGVISSTFDSPPNASDYLFSTNDHDLVCLSNGDVLYLTGAFSKRPLDDLEGGKPGWFDDTRRGSFGPGARSIVLVWLSTDGGRTFNFVPEMELDPARIGDGSAVFPQFRNKTVSPPPWDAGGTDGQLVAVDRSNDRLYLSYGCEGLNPDPTFTDFRLTSASVPLNKTVVFTATVGDKWVELGSVAADGWRYATVPLEKGGLALGREMSLTFGRRQPIPGSNRSKFVFDAGFLTFAMNDGTFGWDRAAYNEAHKEAKPANVIAGDLIKANMWAHTICARLGTGRQILLVYPFTPDGDVKNGTCYRAMIYDRDAKPEEAFHQIGEDIAPTGSTGSLTDGWIMHLTAIEVGEGPVLLYWYDIDAAAATGTIRGRLVGGDDYNHVDDFALSVAGGLPRSFALDQDNGAGSWYGDYLTAGGFKIFQKISSKTAADFRYVPMWVEPDGSFRYTNVLVHRQSQPAVLEEQEDPVLEEQKGPFKSPGPEIIRVKRGPFKKARRARVLRRPKFEQEQLDQHSAFRGPPPSSSRPRPVKAPKGPAA